MSSLLLGGVETPLLSKCLKILWDKWDKWKTQESDRKLTVAMWTSGAVSWSPPR